MLRPASCENAVASGSGLNEIGKTKLEMSLEST
jgi:hypothetical protein